MKIDVFSKWNLRTKVNNFTINVKLLRQTYEYLFLVTKNRRKYKKVNKIKNFDFLQIPVTNTVTIWNYSSRKKNWRRPVSSYVCHENESKYFSPRFTFARNVKFLSVLSNLVNNKDTPGYRLLKSAKVKLKLACV